MKVISIDRKRGGYVVCTMIKFFNKVEYYLIHELDDNLKLINYYDS